ncbi:MAG TPA: glycogen/starch/alpha-glucan phosphorylase [Acidobacteriaceae bacterium]|jgi:starch phosphorylase|nr:glycogen/starch/alpha-glucan phosphorylase [Acidobacteriaceae bacterium]
MGAVSGATGSAIGLEGSKTGQRTAPGVDALAQSFLDNLLFVQGRSMERATVNDLYTALAHTVRDRLVERWISTVQKYQAQDVRVVCYLSAEFLTGPHLANNLINLGIYDEAEQAMHQLGLDLHTLIEQEGEPGLGNGGLGRLASCFMDSLATLDIPAIGYGIRYEYGIFDQQIRDGWQVESTDNWLRLGNPWALERPEDAFEVKMGGRTERHTDAKGKLHVHWVPQRVVRGVPHDTPILGYRTNTANTMRLWSAQAVESFDFGTFNHGDFVGAVADKVASENLSKILYPNDEGIQGKQLRLAQQFFFVSCSLQHIVRIQTTQNRPLAELHRNFAIQMNDTHPAIAVAELMRLLMDEHNLEWDAAWHVTQHALSYTNHTLMPEALEQWPRSLFSTLLPRHMEIVDEMNRRHLDDVRKKFPGDEERAKRLSLITESGSNGEPYVRMAYLAALGSHAINGVAALHTELLKTSVLADFYGLTPQKFSNKTNGVTPRRWMLLSNPGLARLLTARIGPGWSHDLEKLRRLEPLVEDAEFRREWRAIRRQNKLQLAAYMHERLGITTDPDSIFDVLVKRLHEYKRQHLQVLHILTLLKRLQKEPDAALVPRTFIFGGKAAPGYRMAKLIIKLIHAVGEAINADPLVRGRLKVVFLPDFSVKLGQRVYPAADVSEQISTAGKEASGTGNMKFLMNGAITVGTLDGANIEIREEVGEENFFLFGLTAEEVERRKQDGYRPREIYEANAELREALDALSSGEFSHGDRGLFAPLVESLLERDEYMLLADYQSYIDCQEQVSAAWQDEEHWTRMSILNVARCAKFSSDRAIRDYCADIWKTWPVRIQL